MSAMRISHTPTAMPMIRSSPRTHSTRAVSPFSTGFLIVGCSCRVIAAMNGLSADFRLLGAVLIAIAGVAAVFIVRGLVAKIVVLVVALVVAAYIAGVLPRLPF